MDFNKKVSIEQINSFIEQALYEDVRDGDHTSLACIPADARTRSKLLIKGEGIVAGVELAQHIFRKVDHSSSIELFLKDGDEVKYGDIVFHVECNARAMLMAERLVLNTMQRMSGIATLSHQFVEKVKGLDVKILDTRKTTPLIRFLEKWAVRIGGAYNYRHGLYDWIMIKDNHIDACGSITKAIRNVKAYLNAKNLNLGITIEVRNFEELEEALKEGGVTQIMLDNFEIPDLKKAVAIIDGRYNVEASGGITLETVRSVAETGVDYISSGALTHSAQSMDISLKVMKRKK